MLVSDVLTCFPSRTLKVEGYFANEEQDGKTYQYGI
jgi:hypothetical protein